MTQKLTAFRLSIISNSCLNCTKVLQIIKILRNIKNQQNRHQFTFSNYIIQQGWTGVSKRPRKNQKRPWASGEGARRHFPLDFGNILLNVFIMLVFNYQWP